MEKAATISQKTNAFIGSSSTESASKSNINTIVMTELVMCSIALYIGTASEIFDSNDQHHMNQDGEESTDTCNKGN